MLNRLFYRPWFMATVTALLFFAVLAIFGEFVNLERERTQQRLHTLVLSQASAARARLESSINSTIHLTRALTAYVAIHPQVNSGEFNALAAEIMSDSSIIRNIGLAPDNVLRFIYPLQGNEAAIGLHYLDNPLQRDAVLHAIEAHHTVVAGPVNLVQGGSGFINRSPIYVDDPKAPNGHRYWGLASVVVDVAALFHQAGISEEHEGVRYALRGRDGLGAAGAPFFGDPRLFVDDAILLPITLPEGSWQLAAIPVHGWQQDQQRLSLYYLGGGVLGALLALLLYILLRERQRVHHLALHDALTGLPNRLHFNLRLEHTLQRSLRGNRPFALLYLDLDEFKPINDQYGHKAGDAVLAETAHRLLATLRRADTVARIGGDEFMVIVEDIAGVDAVCQVANKLIKALGEPIAIGPHLAKAGVSIGISFFPMSGTDADALIRAADQAMYRAKAQGRNRCVCADTTLCGITPAA